MKIIQEVFCSKCGKRQITDRQELLRANLFWRPCEFCNRYGLYRITRHRLTSIREWLMALYQAMDSRFIERALFPNREE